MSQENHKIQFSKEHYGKWVVISKEKCSILASSTNLAPLSEKFGTNGVVYTKALDPKQVYAF